MSTDNDELPNMICGICGFESPNYAGIKKHMEAEHPVEDNESTPADNTVLFDELQKRVDAILQDAIKPPMSTRHYEAVRKQLSQLIADEVQKAINYQTKRIKKHLDYVFKEVT